MNDFCRVFEWSVVSISGASLLRAIDEPAPRVRDQPSGIDDGLPGGRQGFHRICLARRAVDDFPLRDLTIVSDAPPYPGCSDHAEAEVHGILQEDPGEPFCDNDQAMADESGDGLFARGAAAEILSREQDAPGRYAAGCECRVEVGHVRKCELRRFQEKGSTVAM